MVEGHIASYVVHTQLTWLSGGGEMGYDTIR